MQTRVSVMPQTVGKASGEGQGIDHEEVGCFTREVARVLQPLFEKFNRQGVVKFQNIHANTLRLSVEVSNSCPNSAWPHKASVYGLDVGAVGTTAHEGLAEDEATSRHRGLVISKCVL